MERPSFVGQLLEEITRMVDDQVFTPLPSQAFPLSESARAFRHMAQAKHIGKIVFAMPPMVEMLQWHRVHDELRKFDVKL